MVVKKVEKRKENIKRNIPIKMVEKDRFKKIEKREKLYYSIIKQH